MAGSISDRSKGFSSFEFVGGLHAQVEFHTVLRLRIRIRLNAAPARWACWPVFECPINRVRYRPPIVLAQPIHSSIFLRQRWLMA